MNNFFKFVLCAELGWTPAPRGLTPGEPIYLFSDVSADAVIASIATLSDAGTPSNNSLHCNLHNHDFSCNEELNCVVIRWPARY